MSSNLGCLLTRSPLGACHRYRACPPPRSDSARGPAPEKQLTKEAERREASGQQVWDRRAQALRPQQCRTELLLLPVAQKAGPQERSPRGARSWGTAQVQGREWVSYKEQPFSEDPRLEAMPSLVSGNRVTQAHVRFLLAGTPGS